MKELTDYHTEVYLNDIKEKNISDLENLCKQKTKGGNNAET